MAFKNMPLGGITESKLYIYLEDNFPQDVVESWRDHLTLAASTTDVNLNAANVDTAMTWAQTPQGADFWSKIQITCNRIKNQNARIELQGAPVRPRVARAVAAAVDPAFLAAIQRAGGQPAAPAPEMRVVWDEVAPDHEGL